MVFLGAVGLGAVWGWTLGFWNGWGHGRRVWLNAAASALATLPFALLSQVFGGWRGVVAFAVTAALALIFHLAWLSRLRAQSRT